MNTLIQIPLSKQIAAVRLGDQFYGVIRGQDDLYITRDHYDTAFKAANAARALKKEKKIKFIIASKHPDFTSTRLPTATLLTEADIQAMGTPLRVKEVWVIQAPDSMYITSLRQHNTLMTTSADRKDALVFPTYESASLEVKTLEFVGKKGFKLRRFFVKT